MNVDGSHPTTLYRAESITDVFLNPAWSPIHEEIAFWDPDGAGALNVIDAQSGSVRTLARADDFPGSTIGVEWPAWSPDGYWLAVAGCCDTAGSLFLVSAEGGMVMSVPGAAAVTGPAWEPGPA